MHFSVEAAAEATNAQVELEAKFSEGTMQPAANPSPFPARSLVVSGADGDEAQKILALISEIGSNQMLKEDFHPWFWGPNPARMMTV
jgi:hypothetical protein